MIQIEVTIPEPFIAPLDELVSHTGAGSREEWLKNVVRDIIINYQTQKDVGPEFQKRMLFCRSLWP